MKPIRCGVALLLILAGCRTGGWLAPTADEPETVVSRGQSIGNQLVLHGNKVLPPDDRLIEELIAQRAIINERLKLPASVRPINVHLFADAASYHENVTQRIPNFPERRALFVESGESLDVYAQYGVQVAVDLRHEVAHGYLHAAVPNLPLWLDEGLAEFFEVARGHDGVNRPHVVLLRGQADVAGWKPDLRRLEALDDAAQMTQLDYAESWLWVHFLLESGAGRAEILTQTLAALRRGEAPQPISRQLRRRLAYPEPALMEYLESLY